MPRMCPDSTPPVQPSPEDALSAAETNAYTAHRDLLTAALDALAAAGERSRPTTSWTVPASIGGVVSTSLATAATRRPPRPCTLPASATGGPNGPGRPQGQTGWSTRCARRNADRSIQIRPRPPPSGSGDRYGHPALAGELLDLARVPEGSRNHSFNRAAFRLGQLVGAGLLDDDGVRSRLVKTAEQIGLGAPEATRTLASGMTAGIDQPRLISQAWHPAPELRGLERRRLTVMAGFRDLGHRESRPSSRPTGIRGISDGSAVQGSRSLGPGAVPGGQ